MSKTYQTDLYFNDAKDMQKYGFVIGERKKRGLAIGKRKRRSFAIGIP